jgi:hypothetical protein
MYDYKFRTMIQHSMKLWLSKVEYLNVCWVINKNRNKFNGTTMFILSMNVSSIPMKVRDGF